MSEKESVRLQVQIQPNASQNKIASFTGKILKVRIAAPPVEGKANQKLIEFLSDVLDTAKSNIVIESGHTGKHKLLSIKGMTLEKINERLERQLK